MTPSSPTFGGVEMANSSDRSRLPAQALMASNVSSVTTWSSSTSAMLGSQPCRLPGSAIAEQPIQPDGGGQSALAVAGGDGDQRLAGSGVVQHPADDFSLPGAQFHAVPRPVPLGTVTYRSMKAIARHLHGAAGAGG
jgi:hypothetical protein